MFDGVFYFMAYVYSHTRLDTNVIFYIGIGSDSNYKRANQKCSRNRFWKSITNKTEYSVSILHDNISWDDACKIEIDLISKYGRSNLGNGTLCNLTNGGEGVLNMKHSKESKKRMSIFRKGKNIGRKASQETKDKISASLKGKPKSKEHIFKIQQSKKEKNLPPCNIKKVIDTKTNIIYNSAKEASIQFGINYKYLSQMLTGKRINRTPLIYLSNYNQDSI